MPNMIRPGKRSGSIHLYQLQKKNNSAQNYVNVHPILVIRSSVI